MTIKNRKGDVSNIVYRFFRVRDPGMVGWSFSIEQVKWLPACSTTRCSSYLWTVESACVQHMAAREYCDQIGSQWVLWTYDYMLFSTHCVPIWSLYQGVVLTYFFQCQLQRHTQQLAPQTSLIAYGHPYIVTRGLLIFLWFFENIYYVFSFHTFQN